MTSTVSKLYIAHCPKCHAVLKEISPVPFSRCHGCNSILMVQINRWKLEETSANTNYAPSERPATSGQSENLGLINDVGSVSICGNENPACPLDTNGLSIPNEKNKENWVIGKDGSASPESERGDELEISDFIMNAVAPVVNDEKSSQTVDEKPCCVDIEGVKTESDFGFEQSKQHDEKTGSLHILPEENETVVSSKAHEKIVSPTNEECPSHVPVRREPVSMRTYRARKKHAPIVNLDDKKEGKPSLTDKNAEVVSEAADEGDNSYSPSSSELSNLSPTAENIVSPENCEFSSKKEISISSLQDGVQVLDASSHAYYKENSMDQGKDSTTKSQELCIHGVDSTGPIGLSLVKQEYKDIFKIETENLIFHSADAAQQMDQPSAELENDHLHTFNRQEFIVRSIIVSQEMEQPLAESEEHNTFTLEPQELIAHDVAVSQQLEQPSSELEDVQAFTFEPQELIIHDVAVDHCMDHPTTVPVYDGGSMFTSKDLISSSISASQKIYQPSLGMGNESVPAFDLLELIVHGAAMDQPSSEPEYDSGIMFKPDELIISHVSANQKMNQPSPGTGNDSPPAFIPLELIVSGVAGDQHVDKPSSEPENGSRFMINPKEFEISIFSASQQMNQPSLGLGNDSVLTVHGVAFDQLSSEEYDIGSMFTPDKLIISHVSANQKTNQPSSGMGYDRTPAFIPLDLIVPGAAGDQHVTQLSDEPENGSRSMIEPEEFIISGVSASQQMNQPSLDTGNEVASTCHPQESIVHAVAVDQLVVQPSSESEYERRSLIKPEESTISGVSASQKMSQPSSATANESGTTVDPLESIDRDAAADQHAEKPSGESQYDGISIFQPMEFIISGASGSYQIDQPHTYEENDSAYTFNPRELIVHGVALNQQTHQPSTGLENVYGVDSNQQMHQVPVDLVIDSTSMLNSEESMAHKIDTSQEIELPSREIDAKMPPVEPKEFSVYDEPKAESSSALKSRELIVHIVSASQPIMEELPDDEKNNGTMISNSGKLIDHGAAASQKSNQPFTELENNSASLSMHPEIVVHSAAGNRDDQPSSTRRKIVNPKHAELLMKLDELKAEIASSMGQRKGDKPRSTKDPTQIAQKNPVRKHGLEKFQQPPSNSHHPRKESRPSKSLSPKDPFEMPISDKTEYHVHNRNVSQSSVSSNSSSDSHTLSVSGSTSNARETRSPQQNSSLNLSNRGDRKTGRELRRLHNIDKHPPQVRHCRPLLGSAPFVVCYICLELLELPEDFQFTRRVKRLQCGSCFRFLKLSLVNQIHIVPSSRAPRDSSKQHQEKR